MPTKRKAAKLPPNTYMRGNTIWGWIEIAGKRHRASLRTSDRAEAEARVADWKRKLTASALGHPECPSFELAALKWADEVLPGAVKPNVAKRYLVSVGQLAVTMGGMPVDTITTRTISEYISSRAKFASNATIRRDLTALSRLLASCIAWGWRQDNPAHLYDRSVIREMRDPICPPNPKDVATLIFWAPPGMADCLTLLAGSGMRANEAAQLEGRALDHAARTTRLMVTKTNRPRVINWRTPGGDVSALLVGKTTEGFLFLNEEGGPYLNFSSNVAQLMRRVMKTEAAAGREFRRFRVHDLRHAFAIRWLAKGGGIYALSKHLGHSSVKTTEIYLDYLTGEQQQRAVASDYKTRGEE